MQIVENWTDIEGKVVSCAPSEELPGFHMLELAVEKAREVEGFANLLNQTVGHTLTVFIRADLAALDDCRPQAEAVCRVRRATNKRNFVHPEKITFKAR